jgi:hypothetical protein
MAELFAAHPNLVFAKMDAQFNMLEGLNIERWPIVRFFPRNNTNRQLNGDMIHND